MYVSVPLPAFGAYGRNIEHMDNVATCSRFLYNHCSAVHQGQCFMHPLVLLTMVLRLKGIRAALPFRRPNRAYIQLLPNNSASLAPIRSYHRRQGTRVQSTVSPPPSMCTPTLLSMTPPTSSNGAYAHREHSGEELAVPRCGASRPRCPSHIKCIATCPSSIVRLSWALDQISIQKATMVSHAFRALLGLAALTLAATSAGATAISPRVVHERRSTIPHGWSLQRRADPQTVIPLSFALSQPNIENLETYLLDIADPASPNYGKHWSPSRVAETFSPTPETVGTVTAWLSNEAGVDPTRIKLSKDGGYLDLKVTIGEAEAMLATEYYVYEHKDGTEHVACEDRYHLPEHVAKHVDTVWPTVHFDVVPLSRRSDAVAPGRSPGQATPSSEKLNNLKSQVCVHCVDAVTSH